MGIFHELQTIATKEVKYKQGALFDNRLGFWKNRDLDPSNLKKVGSGICAALSMAYLKDFLSWASENTLPMENQMRFKRGQGLPKPGGSKEDRNTLKVGVESA